MHDCFEHFKVRTPNGTKDMDQIARVVNCSRRTVYEAWKRYRRIYGEPEWPTEEEFDPGRTIPPPPPKYKKPKRKRGTSEEEASHPTSLKEAGLPAGLSFSRFCRTVSWPPYKGLFKWQEECFKEIWDERLSAILVPREHGKSVLMANIEQWAMLYASYDILHLGWTSRRKEIAEYVYALAIQWDLVATSSSTSQYHFQLTTGARYDNYLITSKETLGLHAKGEMARGEHLSDDDLDGFSEKAAEKIRSLYAEGGATTRKLLIVIDDPIDDSFIDFPHKEEALERRFKSTILNIHPHKWIFAGTRKFEGDFFDFLRATFKKKLHIYQRAPYNDKEGNPIDLDDPAGSVLCPEMFTRARLKEIRRENGQYWWSAEYKQDPHPITGEIWDRIPFAPAGFPFPEVDVVVISVDRATTTNESSDLTGITVIARRRTDGRKRCLDDQTGKYTFEETLATVQELYRNYRNLYPRSTIRVVVEKQGGGEDFCSSARSRGIPFANALVEVHSSRDKIRRITDYLEVPIKTSRLAFVNPLKNSEVVEECETFPYCRHFDAIDSLATGVHAMEELTFIRDSPREIAQALRGKRKQAEVTSRVRRNWRRMTEPWNHR